MPLKPIFERAPLRMADALPLRAGQGRMKDEILEQLLRLAAKAEPAPSLWEGMLRVEALLEEHPEKGDTAARVMVAVTAQAEDGSLPMSLADSVSLMRACFVLYERTAEKTYAEPIMRWCGWLNAHWDEAIACGELRCHPADLLELLVQLYRVTGKKALLGLLEKLRRGSMDWSGILHTFSIQRPMSKVTPWTKLQKGIEQEQDNEQGFYTRQSLAAHGASLGDGARAASLNGTFSGNGQELSACRTGWEKIVKQHGAVCGGITSDEMVAGTSPAAGIDMIAVAAWCEALCLATEQDDGVWSWEAVERMLLNAIPHALIGDELQSLIRVNDLRADPEGHGAYHLSDRAERDAKALARLLRAVADVMSHAVMARKDGATIGILRSGRYTVPTEHGTMQLCVDAAAGKSVITVRVRQPLKAALAIRIPSWAEEACLSVNDEGGDEGKPGTMTSLEREWHDGDRISVEWHEALHVSEGYHQGEAVYLGGRLLCLSSDRTDWAVALTDAPVADEDGTVSVAAAPVEGWRLRSGIPADLPVLPAVTADATVTHLAPYASTHGIALFPKGHRA